VLDQRGVVDRFLAEGKAVQVQAFAGVPMDISDFPTRHNYGMALLQSHVERILAGWLDELGVPFLRERQVTGFTQDDSGVDVTLSDGTSLRAHFLVGCDGGRSAVRKAAGIEFAGWDPTTRWIIAEVEMEEKPEFGLRGGGGIGPAEEGRVGVTLIVPDLDSTDELTLQDVRDALIRVDGKDYGVHSPRWISSFTDLTRQAVAYRSGRVLLAGDAAHVHAPMGGQGLNIGVQDSVNLGWKLAQVVQLVDASYAGAWELPVIGEVAAPSAVLIRPDGHVAWVGEGSDAGLRAALTTWFGSPTALGALLNG
jgi:2-polyprenyl-6-methoxyphenol hydroxylase-like FAD-dependent oxidoreductase